MAETKARKSSNKRPRASDDSSVRVDPRTTPHSIDAEQALLASCVLEGGQDSVSRCIEARVTANSFYKPAHQLLYQCIVELYENQIALDEVILCDKLREKGEFDAIGGYAYIHEVLDRIESHAHLQHYIKTVRDLALLRGLIRTCQQTIEDALTGQEEIEHFLNNVEQDIFRLSESRISDSAVGMDDIMESATRQVQLMIQQKGALTGVPTGFKDLDKLTTGFHSPQMVVVAARPGMGKTSMALNMAEAAILPKDSDPVPTLMFSLEMGAGELGMRLLCSRARVDMEKLRDGFLSREMSKNIADAAGELRQAPLYVDDSANLNILEMRAKARRMKARRKIGLVVIDYLQLVNATDSRIPRHEQLGEVSRGIKGMAKELEIPVVALCQLNRETEKEKRQPRMSDLRESGSIEQDADIVLLISRRRGKEDDDEATGNIVPRDLIIAKQRNGPTGSVPLNFNPSITRFENAAFES